MIPLHQVLGQFEAFASLLWWTVPQTATQCEFGESLEVLLYALNQSRLCRRAGGAFKRSSLRLDLLGLWLHCDKKGGIQQHPSLNFLTILIRSL